MRVVIKFRLCMFNKMVYRETTINTPGKGIELSEALKCLAARCPASLLQYLESIKIYATDTLDNRMVLAMPDPEGLIPKFILAYKDQTLVKSFNQLGIELPESGDELREVIENQVFDALRITPKEDAPSKLLNEGKVPTAVFLYGLAASTGYEVCGQYQNVSASQYGALVGAMESIMSEDFKRKRFEAWAGDQRLDLVKHPDGRYVFNDAKNAWKVWNAALSNINMGE